MLKLLKISTKSESQAYIYNIESKQEVEQQPLSYRTQKSQYNLKGDGNMCYIVTNSFKVFGVVYREKNYFIYRTSTGRIAKKTKTIWMMSNWIRELGRYLIPIEDMVEDDILKKL